MQLNRFFLIAFACVLTFMEAGADVASLPTCTVNGKLYHYYDVAPKETVYSLCRKLGVTKDELVKYNPAVADGLKAGAKLYFPADEVASDPQTAASPERVVTHHVERGETIFGIANRYGVTTQSLIEENPVLKDGLKAGQNIRVIIPGSKATVTKVATPGDALAASAVTQVQSAQPTAYVVGKKETLYSIARAHDITVHELEEANPGLTTIREGQILNLPASASASKNPPSGTSVAGGHESVEGNGEVAVVNEPANDMHASAVESQDEETDNDEMIMPERRETSVALMLPFMLEETTPGKTAQRFTEFYKGFLVAVDSLRNTGRPIHVGAFDTGGSVDKTRAILQGDEIKEYAAIIAPDNAECLAAVAAYGKANGVAVINVFSPRDEHYIDNPSLYQTHLPSNDMTAKAVDAMCDRLSYSKPVFINIKDVAGDKADFVAELKKGLDERKIEYQEITVNGRLTPADLLDFQSTGTYTFIPSSSRQADINKIMPGLLEWQEKAVTPIVKIIGYPEWITFRGETLANMHKLNAVVYSRFFADDNSDRTRDIDSKFKRWYGSEMESTIPRHGLLGFDIGMYMLQNIDSLTEGSYDGVQNGFAFRHSDGAKGAANTVLYLVHFRPGGTIEKIKL